MNEIISNLDTIIEELVKKSQETRNKPWLASKKWKLLDIINNLQKCTKELKEIQ